MDRNRWPGTIVTGRDPAPGSGPTIHGEPDMNAVLPLADLLMMIAVLVLVSLVTLALTRADESWTA